MKIQAIADVSVEDLAHSISKMEAYEIRDLFLMVAERMSEPKDILLCAARLEKHCAIRFGTNRTLEDVLAA